MPPLPAGNSESASLIFALPGEQNFFLTGGGANVLDGSRECHWPPDYPRLKIGDAGAMVAHR